MNSRNEAAGTRLRSLFRPLLPTGLLNLFREWKAFRRIGLGGKEAIKGALTNAQREQRRTLRVDEMPEAAIRDVQYVVDVGAERGMWSEAVLDLFKPTTLLSIEPSPQSAAELRRRVSKHQRCEVVECAVGAEAGSATLHVMSDPLWNSLLTQSDAANDLYQPVQEEGTVEVKMSPLDEVVAHLPRIDILKIDVQGYELNVIEGATEALKKTCLLMLETNFVSHYEGDELFCELHQAVTSRGFQLHRIASPYYSDAGRLLYADAIFVNNAAPR